MALAARLWLTLVIAGALMTAASTAVASSWLVSAGVARGQGRASAAPAPPPTPTAACASNTTVTVTWTAVTHATGYTVYQATSSAGLFSPVTSVAGTTWTSGTLSAGPTTYFWKVATKVAANWISTQSTATAGNTISSSNPRCR